MRQRIEKHRAERGDAYRTVEAPLDVAGAIEAACRDAKVAVVDCLTVWLGNLMHHHGVDRDPYQEVCALLECLKRASCELILVSNEIGMGLIPENPLGRQFRDTAGQINQAVAEIADNVIFMVSGIPLKVKEFVP
jgi:adenosylcobinamide kinase/adenosylcobinamide-phosphate guanylyltransferase